MRASQLVCKEEVREAIRKRLVRKLEFGKSLIIPWWRWENIKYV